MKKLGVLSDTHGQFGATRKAIRLFEEQGVAAIIHCGDIGGCEIVRAFQGIETHFVFGNSDGENDLLRNAAEETGNTLHGWFGSLEIEGKKIGFLHGHQNDLFERELQSGRWDLICYGHTHFPALHRQGETLLLNPGAFQRVAVPKVAIVELPELEVRSFSIEY